MPNATGPSSSAHNHDTYYDAAGSAASVQTALDAHAGDTDNPHAVTAVQIGAAADDHDHGSDYDAAGSAASVQTALDVHTGSTGNPHSVTAGQIGAAEQVHDHSTEYDALGSAASVEAALTGHINDVANAHVAGAISVTPTGDLAAADVQAALEELQAEIVSVGGGGGAIDADDLTTATGSAGQMMRVAAAGGLEYRSGAEVTTDIGAAPSAALADLSGVTDAATARTNLGLGSAAEAAASAFDAAGSAASVQTALDAHEGLATDAHDASAVSVDTSGVMVETEVQSALEALRTDIDGAASAAHSHTLSDITDAGTAASHNVPTSGDAAAGEVVLGDDSRLAAAASKSIIFAEENGDLSTTENNGYQFSFGNGVPSDTGLIVPACTATWFGVVTETSCTATIEVYKNGSGTGATVVLSSATSAFATISEAFAEGDLLNFRTVSGSGGLKITLTLVVEH